MLVAVIHDPPEHILLIVPQRHAGLNRVGQNQDSCAHVLLDGITATFAPHVVQCVPVEATLPYATVALTYAAVAPCPLAVNDAVIVTVTKN